ncbi:MAG: 5-formyltetrahydrofolate cyclo-ligase, partial [Kiloniellales bacterium]|nr:5-formyltetrahydrofolate cyclo-ligase [Kiloniellales bacterium]
GAHLLVQATEEMKGNGSRGTAEIYWSGSMSLSSPGSLYLETYLKPKQSRPPAIDLDNLKRAARKDAMSRRAVAAAAAGDGAGSRLAANADAVIAEIPCSIVSVFWPLPGEIDTLELMEMLHDMGKTVTLPVMQGSGKPLVFRSWAPGDRLVEAAFNTLEPEAGRAQRVPDLLFVPLLAFDRHGYRLGYGGGFYDRTLGELRRTGDPLTIGIGFDGQEIEAVPRGEHDQRLDYLVTDARILKIE